MQELDAETKVAVGFQQGLRSTGKSTIKAVVFFLHDYVRGVIIKSRLSDQ